MFLAILAASPLIIRAMSRPGGIYVVSACVFIVSMIMLYGASTAYHTFNLGTAKNLMLKKLDHMMISVLIAGTYTPVCLIVLHGFMGYLLLSLVWGIAVVGIIINIFWINCPKWFSSLLYIAMGWVCVIAFRQIWGALSTAAFAWLLAGGIIYTIGGVIYALKLPIFNARHKFFGSHEIFHLFVMAGSLCHFVFIYAYVLRMPIA
jgi:hemolysin III